MLRRAAVELANALLKHVDTEIVKRSHLDRLVGSRRNAPSFRNAPLPEGAEDYLRIDNPRLLELQARYKALPHLAMRHSQWNLRFVRRQIDLRFFRGDNAYLWTFQGVNSEVSYLLAAYYADKHDQLGLLGRLEEDGLFGAHVFRFNNSVTVSSDLLNSILEIGFLERHLHLSVQPGFKVLDIGAGYGRLAHRMVHAFPGIGTYFCVDGVAESTFLSEYYLRFRGIGGKAVAIPFTEIEEVFAGNRIDLVVNIHSFSECTYSAIQWWLDLIQKHQVRYVMIVPNAGGHGGLNLESTEADGKHQDFQQSILARGYSLIAREPKYLDSSVQEYGASPTQYHLFGLTP